MKQLLLYVLLLVITIPVYPQNETYIRSYIDQGYTIMKMIEHPDGSIISHAYNRNGSHKVYKTGVNGAQIWEKTYETEIIYHNYYGATNTDLTPHETIIEADSGAVLVLSKELNKKYGNVVIRKLDYNGDIVFEKMVDSTENYDCKEIELLEAGYIIGLLNNSPKDILIKLDQNFNEEWRSEIIVQYGFTKNLSVARYNDTSFIASSNSGVIRISNGGIVLDTLAIPGRNKIETINDSLILLTYRSGTMRVYNYQQQELWSTNGFELNVIDEKFYSVGHEIREHSLSGVLEKRIPQLNYNNSRQSAIYDILKTSDGSYYYGGHTKNIPLQPLLIKANSDLEIKGLDLYLTRAPGGIHNPVIDSITVLHMLKDYQIYWYSSEDIQNVDIEYSLDNGNSWTEIISYFPADSGYFNWTVPTTLTEDGILRIKESSQEQYQNVFLIAIRDNQDYDYIHVNNIKMWVGNNGIGSHDPNTDGSGFYWPGTEDKKLIYSDGLIWGSKVWGEIQVNGSFWSTGLQPGNIDEEGNAVNPNNSEYKIYKLKRDWQLLPPGLERDKYLYNYLNWPVQNGAPWKDNDYDGIYTPGIDEPEFSGDEMLYYVANDLNVNSAASIFGSLPTGIEQQCLTYGYDREDYLKDVVFKRYRLINKSRVDCEEMMLGYWSDDDLGDAGDDYVGFDSTLSLGYTYNGRDEDGVYRISPGVGHMLLQGPITESIGDSGVYKGELQFDMKNLELSGTHLYINPSYFPAPPYFKTKEEIYNYLQGLYTNGNSFINPLTGDTTKLWLSGDPETGEGWYEGEGWPDGPNPGDRIQMINTGPFTLAPGDTQEVVIAIMAAQGTNRLNSVTELKNLARNVREFYYGQFITDVEDENNNQPISFKLEQNYPNPFNPTTKIKFSIPATRTNSNSSVRLIVYDALGKEVVTLVNEKKTPGNYEVVFNASELSSGVYFYRIQSGSFIQTKKMVLLK